MHAKQQLCEPEAAELLAREHPDRFVTRHVGPGEGEIRAMLEAVGYPSLDEMTAAAVPEAIRLGRPLDLPEAASEAQALAEIQTLAARNQVFRSYIGMGYHDCITPPVILRNLFENPGWYTQYTPYQAEISQGRLEGLLTFQTLVCDLTGLEVANASLLDEATAAAEAMTLCHALRSGEGRQRFLAAADCHPQTLAVLRTRAQPLGIELVVERPESFALTEGEFGMLLQFPNTWGRAGDYRGLVQQARAAGVLVAVAADPLALTLWQPPGEWGADVAVGSMQRFGVPLGYGGPHAAYFAVRTAYKRHLPGRLVGVSKDARGRPAYRLALQTREQHIRREKATSNICTAQALLANVAAMYAVYHGPDNLRAIALRIHTLTRVLACGLRELGCHVPAPGFDTLWVGLERQPAAELLQVAKAHQVNLRPIDEQTVGLSLDETVGLAEVDQLLRIFNGDRPVPFSARELAAALPVDEPAAPIRTSPILTHPVFHRYRSETGMMRYLKRLESRDLSLTTSMIPLGSCTMKLNAAVEMLPVTWPEFGRLHPYAPRAQAEGYRILGEQLKSWLAEITGLAATSLQPNAGSQGEYAGLMVIRAYHQTQGDNTRNVCLIPTSAHGTNPASAVMAGFRVVPVACDAEGNIDLANLRERATEHAGQLAALMVTYPSTHGVFETGIREVCQIVHEQGGQVYMDGANLNAQVGLCRPGDLGADVCHINLHKTFCIPHGGGGPGMGPICVARHLTRFLPGHPVVTPEDAGELAIGPISAAPWGSASILPISWLYIRMMGAQGLRRASQVAILNANYVARRLSSCFPVLYRGPSGLVAHECIFDLRQFKGTTVEDVAKRLMDFGFHAPTVSWPVAGTLMVEPTESESKEELDRFCDALRMIHGEIMEVESGRADPRNNPLKHAPHTADVVTASAWDRPYSREQAAFPASWLREYKYWPPVARIDNVYGDRNPVCTCAGLELLAEPAVGKSETRNTKAEGPGP
jgi:glycine dehydrogenase